MVNLITIEEIKIYQNRNQEIQKEKNKLILKDEIYFKKIKARNQIVLSEELSNTLITNVLIITYCHLGTTPMINKLTPFFSAKNNIAKIKQTCEKCKICIKNKTRRNQNIV